MSTVDAEVETPGTPVRASDPAAGHTELSTARIARVGDIEVRRLLPLRLRRSVGGWCFVDHYGPTSVDGVAGMRVPPHPHIGLQTVTWLLAGNVLHRDSLGSEQMIRPGQLNLMTAGRGIAHAEESPTAHDPTLHGVQLWLALPGPDRWAPPAFEHHRELPALAAGGLQVTVFAGSLADVTSPARTFSPVVGAEISAARDTAGSLPLVPSHEHVIFVADGQAAAGETHHLSPGRLLYLAPGRDSAAITARAGTRLLLLGGEPLGEPLLMWWNFVARTPADITQAAQAWADGQFGDVPGYRGVPMPAPPLDPARLRPARLPGRGAAKVATEEDEHARGPQPPAAVRPLLRPGEPGDGRRGAGRVPPAAAARPDRAGDRGGGRQWPQLRALPGDGHPGASR